MHVPVWPRIARLTCALFVTLVSPANVRAQGDPSPRAIMRSVDVAHWSKEAKRFVTDTIALPALSAPATLFASAVEQLYTATLDSALTLFRSAQRSAQSEKNRAVYRWSVYGEGVAQLTRAANPLADSLQMLAVSLARTDSDSTLMARALMQRSANPIWANAPIRKFWLDTIQLNASRDDAETLAQLQCLRSQYEIDSESSERIVGAAVRNAERAGVLRTQILCKLSSARRAQRIGRNSFAIEQLLFADSVARLIGDHSAIAQVNQQLGYTNNISNKIRLAQQNLTIALEEATTVGSLGIIAYTWMNLGIIADKGDDRVRAARYLDNSEKLLAELRNERGRLDVLITRGQLLLSAGDFDASKRALLSAQALAREQNDPRGIDQARYQLIFHAIASGDTAAALRRLDERDAYWRGQPGNDWQWLSSRMRGQLAMRMKQYDSAIVALKTYLEIFQSLNAPERFSSGIMLAAAYTCGGNATKGAAIAFDALDSLDRFRESLREFGGREISAMFRPDPPSRGPSSVSSLVGCLARTNVAQAFLIAERVRDRRLREALIDGSLNLFKSDSGAVTRTVSARAISLSGLERALPDSNTVVLSYSASDPITPVTLFATSKRGTKTYTLTSPDSLRQLVGRLRAVIASDRNQTALARELGNKLLQAAIRDIPPNTRHLVIIPDADLFDVPWNILETNNTTIGIRYATTLAPSASVAAERWSRAEVIAPFHVLAYGGPVLAIDSLPKLPSAAAEALAVSRRDARGLARIGNLATESSLKNTPLANVSVMHFAAHAQPAGVGVTANAGLVFLTPTEFDDGYLEASEISRLRLNGALVVLSACASATAQPVAGEGARSLATAFMQAGASAVLATQWPVGDSEIVPLVSAFYDEFAQGRTAGESLQRAQDKLRRKSVPPRVWSAFTLIGDGHMRVQPTR